MKTYKVEFMSADNVNKSTEVVADNAKGALQIVKKNYKGYKNFKPAKLVK